MMLGEFCLQLIALFLFKMLFFKKKKLSFYSEYGCTHNIFALSELILKVRPPQLIDYLQQKKAEGYTIIGVEQTAKSCNLTQYCFPEKSLLLLG